MLDLSPTDVLRFLLFLIVLGFHIFIVVKIIQDGHTGFGVASILLTCCCFLGYLLTLNAGWSNAARWKIRSVMIVYTVVFLAHFGLTLIRLPDLYYEALRQSQLQREQQRR